MNRNIRYIIGGIITIIAFCILGYFELFKEPPKTEGKATDTQKQEEREINKIKVNVTNYDYKVIKEVNNNYNDNYMISPMSIAYALSILKEGAKNNTKSQLSILLNNYKLQNITSVNNRISIANTLFIKSEYKKDITDNYISKIENNYNSGVLIDEFKTPKVINEWISEKTFNMINNAIDNLSNDFVLGVANAIAIDVEWKNKFDCSNTKESEFNLNNGSKMSTPYMSSSNDVYYIESDDAKGIIKDYKIYNKTTGEEVTKENNDTIALEYIAILPNNDIKEYINNLDNIELSKLANSKKESNEKLDINYSIPRYTYDFDYDKFNSGLNNLGISEMFNPKSADFSNMLHDKSNLKLYVSSAIHKTHIEFSENGTKAAAVSAFVLDNALSIEPEKEKIEIKFNKPFIYIIKEKNSDNIWFFGTVYKPDEWNDGSNNNCQIN